MSPDGIRSLYPYVAYLNFDEAGTRKRVVPCQTMASAQVALEVMIDNAEDEGMPVVKAGIGTWSDPSQIAQNPA